MDSASQIETREISDRELDEVAGGFSVADVSVAPAVSVTSAVSTTVSTVTTTFNSAAAGL
jgi:hypothetical protein